MGAMLTKEQFDRECGYRLALSIIGTLRENGLITSKEYGHIEISSGKLIQRVTNHKEQIPWNQALSVIA